MSQLAKARRRPDFFASGHGGVATTNRGLAVCKAGGQTRPDEAAEAIGISAPLDVCGRGLSAIPQRTNARVRRLLVFDALDLPFGFLRFLAISGVEIFQFFRFYFKNFLEFPGEILLHFGSGFGLGVSCSFWRSSRSAGGKCARRCSKIFFLRGAAFSSSAFFRVRISRSRLWFNLLPLPAVPPGSAPESLRTECKEGSAEPARGNPSDRHIRMDGG